MRFEWDPEKSTANRRKHRISFEKATELWNADFLEIYDEAHSDEEDRFIGVGMVDQHVVIVVFTEPEDDLVRIVSARMAKRPERHLFELWERQRNE